MPHADDTSTAPAVTTAVSQDDLEIPLIDFSTFLHGTPTERKTAATAILSGFQRAGFIYLSHHGIPASSIASAFAQSAGFFKRPLAEKDGLAWDSARSNRGYTCMGREKTTTLKEKAAVEELRLQNPDIKESFEIGRDDEADMPNHWPAGDEEARAFREYMVGFHRECAGLHVEVMRALALGLGIDEDWFDQYTDVGDNTLRLLHYPSVRKDVFQRNKGQVRAGAHSDYGSITLLFQDNRGGLQVRSPNGNFINATPIPGTIVINAGDLLAMWSNDTIKSTIHRVVEPPAPADGDEHPARYSIAYFCNPNFDKFIDVIPSTVAEGAQKKYPGINSGDYLEQRLTATY